MTGTEEVSEVEKRERPPRLSSPYSGNEGGVSEREISRRKAVPYGGKTKKAWKT